MIGPEVGPKVGNSPSPDLRGPNGSQGQKFANCAFCQYTKCYAAERHGFVATSGLKSL